MIGKYTQLPTTVKAGNIIGTYVPVAVIIYMYYSQQHTFLKELAHTTDGRYTVTLYIIPGCICITLQISLLS